MTAVWPAWLSGAPTSVGAPAPVRARSRRQRRIDAQIDRLIAGRERQLDTAIAVEMREAWRMACERPSLGLSHQVSTVLGGTNAGRMPRLQSIHVGSSDADPTTAVVELPAGLTVEDLEDVGGELASAMRCHRLRFEPVEGPYVHMTLVQDDPHASGQLAGAELIAGSIALGVDEFGSVLRMLPGDMPHCAVQGTTGGGKSTALYWIMKQIVAAPGCRLAGLDPSDLLFRALPADPWRRSGLGDPRALVDTLRQLCDEMDARNSRMPWDEDRLPCGPDEPDPWLFVVLEELPGLLADLEAIDRKLAALARLYIGRLAAEGRKSGLRLVMAAQRFSSQDTAGATVRSNCGLRVSFRVENRAAVEFLHEGCSPDVSADHITAQSGIALVTVPGRPLSRMKFPLVTYREWAHAARAACLPLDSADH